MKVINNINYYTIDEMLKVANERHGIKIVKNNTILQWLYRHNFPKYIDKNHGNYNYYPESVVEEIIAYYYRRKQIKDIQSELKQKTRALIDDNKAFLKKYSK